MDFPKTLAFAAIIAMGLHFFASSTDSPKSKQVASAGFALSAPDFEPVPIVEPESIVPQDCKDGSCQILPSIKLSKAVEPTPIVSSVAPIPVVVYESSPVMVSAPVVSSSVVAYSAPIVTYTYSTSDDCANYSRPMRTPVRNIVRGVASLPVRIIEARPIRSVLSRVFRR